jgi:hypothetical protein
MDLRDINARIVELRAQVASLELPKEPHTRCPLCGITFRHQRQVDEHTYNSHNGPIPAHYLAAEALAE